MMNEANNTKPASLEEMKDQLLGLPGSAEREAYEQELRMELLGAAVKSVRKHRKLTQAQLGTLVGVQKAQISKIEHAAHSASVDTLTRIFNALGADLHFQVHIDGKPFRSSVK